MYELSNFIVLAPTIVAKMSAYRRFKIADLREMCTERNINVDVHQKKRDIIAMLEHYDETMDCDNECDYDVENNDDMNNELMNANDDDDNEVMISDRLIERNDSARRQPAASAATSDSARVTRGAGARDNPDSDPTVTALKLQLELVTAQAEAREREWQIERERAQLYGNDHGNPSSRHGVTDTRDIKSLLPQLASDDVLTFFNLYERVMILNNVDRVTWARFLPPQLSPRALKVYNKLSMQQSVDYDCVKAAILNNFNLNAASYLRQFQTMRRSGTVNYVTHMQNLKETFDRYIQAAGISDMDMLVDAIVKEQFLQSLPPNVRVFVASREPKNSNETAIAADLSFHVSKVEKETKFGVGLESRGPGTSGQAFRFAAQRPVGRTPAPSAAPYRPAQEYRPRMQFGPPRFRGNYHGNYSAPAARANFPRNTFPGMLARTRNAYLDQRDVRDVDCDVLYHNDFDDVSASDHDCEINSENARYIFLLFINGRQCLGLRDTGCFTNLLVAKHLISASDYIPTRYVKMQGLFDNGKLPMAQVSVQSPKFCSNEIVKTTAAICDNLPCKIDCIVGNSFFVEFPELRDVINLQCDSETDRDKTTQNDSDEADRHLHNIVTNGQMIADASKAHIIDVREPGYIDGPETEYVSGDAVDCVHNEVREQTADIGVPCGDNPEVTAATVSAQSRQPLMETYTPERSGESIATHSHAEVMTRIDGPTINTVNMNAATARPGHATARDNGLETAADGDGDARADGETGSLIDVLVNGKHDTDTRATRRADQTNNMSAAIIRQTDSDDRLSAVCTRSSHDRLETAADSPTSVAPPGELNETYDQLAADLRFIDMSDRQSNDALDRTQTDFMQAQQNDNELAHLWDRVSQGADYLCVRNGLLYRKIPDNITGTEEWALVLPKDYAHQVIKAAHSNPLSAHFGSRKTEKKIAQLFFFPRMRQKISQYIQSCKACQLVKPIKKNERAPLQEMDILPDSVFSDVSLDFIGSELPMTKRKNKYVMVIICSLSKWVNVIPLKSLRAEEIADNLIQYFSDVGIPKVIRSDNMPSFRSELMEALCTKLNIQQKFSAPFHFASHGTVERVQSTIETILKKFLQENPADWDKMLPFLSFALRNVQHAATGFSASEIVYGHQMRGLLQILRESWTDGDRVTECKNVTTAQYVTRLTERIEATLKLVRQNMAKAQEQTKRQFDKASTERVLTPGELALVLLPTSSRKMFSCWRGPFKIGRKLENNNYELIIGRRKAIFHINSLRRYYERDTENDAQITMMVLEDDLKDDGAIVYAHDEQIMTDGKQFKISHQLTDRQRTEFEKMLFEFSDVFNSTPGKTNIITHKIQVTDETPSYTPPFRTPETLREPVERELNSMLQNEIIKRDDHSNWNSPLIVIKKPDGGLRLVNSFVALNERTITEPYQMTNLNELLSRAAGCQYITRVDLTQSYYQIELDPDSQKYTTFSSHIGSFSYLRMPQGLKNAPGTCQKMMNIVLRGMHKFSGSLVDDIVIFDKNPDVHLTHVKHVLERLRNAGLTANKTKSIFAENKLKILGHLLVDGQILPDPEKIRTVSEMKLPKTKSQLKSTIGLFSYFRDFVPHFAEIAFPLSDLTGKGKPEKLTWTETQVKAFEKLRIALMSKPILRPPDMTKSFQLHADSSNTALSSILMQRSDENDAGHVICYASRKLLDRERNYSTVEKELLAIVYGLLKFKHYLYGTKVDIYSDHQPIKWMRSLIKHNSRIARWSLFIQDFDFQIHHVPGKQQLADALTRLD